MGVWARLWSAVRGDKRPATTIELLQRAERARREGRPAAAEDLVRQALERDPRSVLGHLLAGYLHAAARRPDEARDEFRAVLSLDPAHPRALLGLARLDIEGGDLASGRQLLERALQIFPDFPEAHALLDLLLGLAAASAGAAGALAPGPELRLQRLTLPTGTRECLIAQADGTVLFSYPASRTRDALAGHLVRLTGIASATLGRAGFGPLRQAAVESNSGLTLVRSDGRVILALTVPPDATMTAARRDAEELWARCLEELGTGAEKSNG